MSETRDYRIEPGDTLSELAQRFGVTIADLMAANPNIKSAHLIHAGDMLRVPGVDPEAREPTVDPEARTAAVQTARRAMAGLYGDEEMRWNAEAEAAVDALIAAGWAHGRQA